MTTEFLFAIVHRRSDTLSAPNMMVQLLVEMIERSPCGKYVLICTQDATTVDLESFDFAFLVGDLTEQLPIPNIKFAWCITGCNVIEEKGVHRIDDELMAGAVSRVGKAEFMIIPPDVLTRLREVVPQSGIDSIERKILGHQFGIWLPTTWCDKIEALNERKAKNLNEPLKEVLFLTGIPDSLVDNLHASLLMGIDQWTKKESRVSTYALPIWMIHGIWLLNVSRERCTPEYDDEGGDSSHPQYAKLQLFVDVLDNLDAINEFEIHENDLTITTDSPMIPNIMEGVLAEALSQKPMGVTYHKPTDLEIDELLQFDCVVVAPSAAEIPPAALIAALLGIPTFVPISHLAKLYCEMGAANLFAYGDREEKDLPKRLSGFIETFAAHVFGEQEYHPKNRVGLFREPFTGANDSSIGGSPIIVEAIAKATGVNIFDESVSRAGEESEPTRERKPKPSNKTEITFLSPDGDETGFPLIDEDCIAAKAFAMDYIPMMFPHSAIDRIETERRHGISDLVTLDDLIFMRKMLADLPMEDRDVIVIVGDSLGWKTIAAKIFFGFKKVCLPNEKKMPSIVESLSPELKEGIEYGNPVPPHHKLKAAIYSNNSSLDLSGVEFFLGMGMTVFLLDAGSNAISPTISRILLKDDAPYYRCLFNIQGVIAMRDTPWEHPGYCLEKLPTNMDVIIRYAAGVHSLQQPWAINWERRTPVIDFWQIYLLSALFINITPSHAKVIYDAVVLAHSTALAVDRSNSSPFEKASDCIHIQGKGETVVIGSRLPFVAIFIAGCLSRIPLDGSHSMRVIHTGDQHSENSLLADALSEPSQYQEKVAMLYGHRELKEIAKHLAGSDDEFLQVLFHKLFAHEPTVDYPYNNVTIEQLKVPPLESTMWASRALQIRLAYVDPYSFIDAFLAVREMTMYMSLDSVLLCPALTRGFDLPDVPSLKNPVFSERAFDYTLEPLLKNLEQYYWTARTDQTLNRVLFEEVYSNNGKTLEDLCNMTPNCSQYPLTEIDEGEYRKFEERYKAHPLYMMNPKSAQPFLLHTFIKRPGKIVSPIVFMPSFFAPHNIEAREALLPSLTRMMMCQVAVIFIRADQAAALGFIARIESNCIHLKHSMVVQADGPAYCGKSDLSAFFSAVKVDGDWSNNLNNQGDTPILESGAIAISQGFTVTPEGICWMNEYLQQYRDHKDSLVMAASPFELQPRSPMVGIINSIGQFPEAGIVAISPTLMQKIREGVESDQYNVKPMLERYLEFYEKYPLEDEGNVHITRSYVNSFLGQEPDKLNFSEAIQVFLFNAGGCAFMPPESLGARYLKHHQNEVCESWRSLYLRREKVSVGPNNIVLPVTFEFTDTTGCNQSVWEMFPGIMARDALSIMLYYLAYPPSLEQVTEIHNQEIFTINPLIQRFPNYVKLLNPKNAPLPNQAHAEQLLEGWRVIALLIEASPFPTNWLLFLLSMLRMQPILAMGEKDYIQEVSTIQAQIGDYVCPRLPLLNGLDRDYEYKPFGGDRPYRIAIIVSNFLYEDWGGFDFAYAMIRGLMEHCQVMLVVTDCFDTRYAKRVFALMEAIKVSVLVSGDTPANISKLDLPAFRDMVDELRQRDLDAALFWDEARGPMANYAMLPYFKIARTHLFNAVNLHCSTHSSPISMRLGQSDHAGEDEQKDFYEKFLKLEMGDQGSIKLPPIVLSKPPLRANIVEGVPVEELLGNMKPLLDSCDYFTFVGEFSHLTEESLSCWFEFIKENPISADDRPTAFVALIRTDVPNTQIDEGRKLKRIGELVNKFGIEKDSIAVALVPSQLVNDPRIVELIKKSMFMVDTDWNNIGTIRVALANHIPIMAFEGSSSHSRLLASVLRYIGLNELICESNEQERFLASRLIHNLEDRHAIKKAMLDAQELIADIIEPQSQNAYIDATLDWLDRLLRPSRTIEGDRQTW